MKFPYSSVIAVEPISGDYLLFRRPEIPVKIFGPQEQASLIGLVDTGSDHTIFPLSVAIELGIDVSSDTVSLASGFGGESIPLRVGKVRLRIGEQEEAVEWRTEVYFYDFKSPDRESTVLGHSSFLDYFIATFDGENGELELKPTAEMLELLET